MLAVLAWGLVHSLLATWGAKKRFLRWGGSKLQRWYRLLYNLIAIVTVLPLLALVYLLPDRQLYALPLPWSAVFILGQLLATVALVMGLLQTDVWSFLGARQLVQPEGQEPERLVTSGLYRWVRHPLYTAGLVLIWLTPLMTLNLMALNVGLTVYILIGTIFEERKLRREFGLPYEEYWRRTPMLIPGLRLGRKD